MTGALIITLLIAVVAVAVIAKRFNVPYPVAFVIGGAALAFIPNIPRPQQLDPQLIFLVVLPPLLFAGGWLSDWTEFKRNGRSILLLGVGLVIFSTVLVAWVGHQIGLSWPMAFTLGAVVSPPDAVAAEAVFEQLSIPRRVAAVLTGEGLVNDATALVLYRYALLAAVTGFFSLQNAALSLVGVALGGIAIGLFVAIVIEFSLGYLERIELQDSLIASILLLVGPYASYLSAETLHASGVLSAVTAGLYLGRRQSFVLDSEARVLSAGVWQVLIFLLNALVFLLIGLQLPSIIRDLNMSPGRFAVDALIVSVAVIVIRLVWVFPAVYLPRWLSKKLRERDPTPRVSYVVLIGWSGMRGIVSLAAALAIPYTDAAGHPLSGRAEIIFITFCVIFATLVLQGLSLAPLIRWLGLSETSSRQAQETSLRIAALESAVQYLHSLEPTFESTHEWEIEGRILGEYAARIDHLKGHLAENNGAPIAENAIDHRLQKEALEAERRKINDLRRDGKIPDDLYRQILYDLDLADLRLA